MSHSTGILRALAGALIVIGLSVHVGVGSIAGLGVTAVGLILGGHLLLAAVGRRWLHRHSR
ncbi:hypothetical protein [Nocardia beijingensis]|uniref:hypothetical protein n=1 Tax=Nocardia beijingensis TaxID=95162 RepID=UPI0008328802|nr:hypothetical protein [Nocardia beijingensis]